MFQIKIVEKIETHILRSATFLLKIMPFMRKCRKIWCNQGGVECGACPFRWLSKATCVQAHTCASLRTQIIILLFHDNDCLVEAPHCYFIRTLPVLFRLSWVLHTALLTYTLNLDAECSETSRVACYHTVEYLQSRLRTVNVTPPEILTHFLLLYLS
jgi:hypothetical protein